MRWIYVRNAVKCGEIFIFTAFTAISGFLTKIHRNHRFSYKNSPKDLDPDMVTNAWSRFSVGVLLSGWLIDRGFVSTLISFGVMRGVGIGVAYPLLVKFSQMVSPKLEVAVTNLISKPTVRSETQISSNLTKSVMVLSAYRHIRGENAYLL